MPAWFENLLPESGSKLRLWLSRQHGLNDRDSFALLAALGRDLVGAVEVIGKAGDSPDSGDEEPYQGEWRFSLAGVQLKLSLLLQGERFVLPAAGKSGSWIVKIPGENFADLPEVEYATMTWARAAGFSTPDFKVCSIDQVSGITLPEISRAARVYAIRRFDREDARRIHQEDFAQALEIEPEHKYGDGPRGIGYDGLARLVRDACGDSEQHEFVRRLAFVVACGNDDAHLKNWSLQWGAEHRPRLSPCYDLVSTVAWPDFGWAHQRGPTLALAFGRRKAPFEQLTRERLLRFVRRGAVENGEELFFDVLKQAREAWRAVVDYAPVRMREGVAEHWRRVPLLRDAGGLTG